MDPEAKDRQSKNQPGSNSIQPSEPAQHVAHAHQLLKSLSEKFGLEKHPELQEAITKLELALNQLTLNTGGML
jgi:hypothetical protein